MGVALTIQHEEVEEKRILRLEGRIDAITSPQLERALDTEVEKGHLRLLLDFTGVDYLSSAGMRLLLSATKKLKAKQGALHICGINDEVMEIIKMAGFERILGIFQGEKEALDKL